MKILITHVIVFRHLLEDSKQLANSQILKNGDGEKITMVITLNI